ncbi:MAG: DUF4399 domain-containing protein [Chloroflexota bacterium]
MHYLPKRTWIVVGLLAIVTVLAACTPVKVKVRERSSAIIRPAQTTETTTTETQIFAPVVSQSGSGEAQVAIVEPADGATVSGPFTVVMSAENFVIEEAGEINEGAGHFHIMVNTDCVAVGEVIPSDDSHLHYGKAQTEAELELPAGDYTLCLQAADGAHRALDLTHVINVTVEEGEEAEASAEVEGTEVSVEIVEPADGATVSGPFTVVMAAENFVIEEAGEINEGAGHFHIMVNTDCVAVGEVIPSDDSHLHYGKAQTEAELELPAGDYTLCLQAADGAHRALDLTHVINVTVEEGEEAEASAEIEVAEASVAIVEPADGATVSGPFTVVMSAENFVIEEAGEINEGAGHFHIMVNTDCVAVGEVIPSDDSHLHYGKAQTEAELELPAGDYTLCLQAADGAHRALDLTHVINISVDAPEASAETDTASRSVSPTADPTSIGWPASVANLPTGDPVNGEAIYIAKTCNACHGMVDVPGSSAVGPWLGDLAERGGSVKEGFTAADYMYESVLFPNEYVVPDCPTGPCPANVMIQNFGEQISQQELADLMAYVLGTSTFDSLW